MIDLRPSWLPRVTACPASATPPAVTIDEKSAPSSMGDAIHEWIAPRISGVDVDAETIIQRHGVDRDEFGTLSRLSLSRWFAVEACFPGRKTEHRFTPLERYGVRLTGTADVVSVVNDEIRILDHKSGWADGDHQDQLRGYGLLALEEFGGEYVTASVLRLRSGVLDTYSWTRSELDEWLNELAASLNPAAFSPSADACRFCPRRYECPARVTMVRNALALIGDTPRTSLATLAPNQVGAMYQVAKTVKDAADFVLAQVRQSVIDAGGTLPISEADELALKSVNRRSVDARLAIPVLERHVGQDWLSAIEMSNKAMEKVIGEHAPARGKGKLIKQVWDELTAADAVVTESTERLELRRRALQLVGAE